MNRKKAAVFAIIATLGILCSLGYVFFAPFVLYVEPEVPAVLGERITGPESTLSYAVGKEGGILSFFRTPSLVVASPMGGGEEYSAPRLVWGGEGEYSLPYSVSDMYSYFLAENDGKAIGILYDVDDEEEKSLAQDLSSSFPSVVPIPYSGRISVVNKEEVLAVMDSLWGVLVMDSGKTREAWSETKARVVMENLSAASSVSLERVVSIEYDWERIITAFLREKRVEAYYTFTVLENSDKV